MRALIRALAESGITVLLSSHLMNEVEELCNRVAIIRSGRIVFEGPLAELMATASAGYRLRATDPARAHAVCLAQSGIHDITSDDGVVRFSADEDSVAGLSIALGEAGVGITALVPEAASLEELFLGLTEGEEPPVAAQTLAEAAA
jgi:ABC-2 type transport system ATP-binding protein